MSDPEQDLRATLVISTKDKEDNEIIGTIRITRGQLRGLNKEMQPSKVIGLMLNGELLPCTILYRGAAPKCRGWCTTNKPGQEVFEMKYPEDRAAVTSFKMRSAAPAPAEPESSSSRRPVRSVRSSWSTYSPADVSSSDKVQQPYREVSSRYQDRKNGQPAVGDHFIGYHGSDPITDHDEIQIAALALSVLHSNRMHSDEAPCSNTDELTTQQDMRDHLMSMDRDALLQLAASHIGALVKRTMEIDELKKKLRKADEKRTHMALILDRLEKMRRAQIEEAEKEWLREDGPQDDEQQVGQMPVTQAEEVGSSME